MDAEYGWIFKQPVDPVELNLPDYFDVVKKPMDLGTVKKKLDNSVYREVDEFIGDVRLVFDNAMLYNGKEGREPCCSFACALGTSLAHKALNRLLARSSSVPFIFP